jgi:hypothetical protein
VRRLLQVRAQVQTRCLEKLFRLCDVGLQVVAFEQVTQSREWQVDQRAVAVLETPVPLTIEIQAENQTGVLVAHLPEQQPVEWRLYLV